MQTLSAWRRRAAALVIAAGAAASVATSMTEWLIEDLAELPPIHLDQATQVIAYEIRAVATGPLDGSGEIQVDLSSALQLADGSQPRVVRATLQNGVPSDTVELYVAPGVTDYLTIPAWDRCPGTPCEQRVTLRLELDPTSTGGGTEADLSGTVSARRTGVGEQPSGVAVDVSLWSEIAQ